MFCGYNNESAGDELADFFCVFVNQSGTRILVFVYICIF